MRSTTRTIGVARWILGGLDLLSAAIYAWVVTALVPSRSTAFIVTALMFAAVTAAGGLGLFSGKRWGRIVTTACSVVMLAVSVLVIVLLLGSAAYLHGIWGGVGQAGALVAVIVALLVIELVALLPIVQLIYVWRSSSTLLERGSR